MRYQAALHPDWRKALQNRTFACKRRFCGGGKQGPHPQDQALLLGGVGHQLASRRRQGIEHQLLEVVVGKWLGDERTLTMA
jgi:hypothetical protein